MSQRNRLVFGVGINDADYPVAINARINGRHNRTWTCPFYVAWKNMLARCYSQRFHKHRPTYHGCSVTQEWLTFSAFREWMNGQDHEGKQLDKDILFPGNKVYGPNTCVFVTRQINSFLTDCGSSRGELPIGVCRDGGRFRAFCRSPFSKKRISLGLFNCPNAAHEAWRSRKHQMSCAYAERQDDPRIAAALRTRYAKTERPQSSESAGQFGREAS